MGRPIFLHVASLSFHYGPEVGASRHSLIWFRDLGLKMCSSGSSYHDTMQGQGRYIPRWEGRFLPSRPRSCRYCERRRDRSSNWRADSGFPTSHRNDGGEAWRGELRSSIQHVEHRMHSNYPNTHSRSVRRRSVGERSPHHGWDQSRQSEQLILGLQLHRKALLTCY
jgi:hypothetical protein